MAQHTDRQFDLKAVAFSDAAHGWAMLGNVALLATTDGAVDAVPVAAKLASPAYETATLLRPGVDHRTVREPRPFLSSGTAGWAMPSTEKTRLPVGSAPVTSGSTAAVQVTGVLVSNTVVVVESVTLEAPWRTVSVAGTNVKTWATDASVPMPHVIGYVPAGLNRVAVVVHSGLPVMPDVAGV